MFSILSEKYVFSHDNKNKGDFRKEIYKLVIEYNDYSLFETELMLMSAMTKDGILSVSEAAIRADMSEESFKKYLES